MGIFGRDQKAGSGDTTPVEPVTPTQASRQPNDRETTVIAGPVVIKGRIVGGSDIRIEGTVEGSIRSEKRVVVQEKGRVRGDVHARFVVIAGSVNGDVTADERIELAPSGRLEGDITAPRILIQEGAAFEGQVNMEAPGKKPANKGSGASGAETAPERAGDETESPAQGDGSGEAADDGDRSSSSNSDRRSQRRGGRKK